MSLPAVLFASTLILGMPTHSLATQTKSEVKHTAKVSIVSLTNPSENYGVNVGDLLTRTVVLSVPLPYKILKEALPKKNSESNGVMLVGIKVDEAAQKDSTLYTFKLDYQTFANYRTPVAMHLPAIVTELKGGEKLLSVEVPAWSFWFSPLAVATIDNASKTLQPDIKPPLINVNTHKTLLFALLGLAGASLLALLYINADGRWLPFMGGAFAQAHRKIKKLSKAKGLKTQREEKQALVHIHQAFNQHYGANIFARDINRFVDMRPGFKKVKTDIERFFSFSNHSLYSTEPRDSSKVIDHLVLLSKQLRDCERGV